jgi:small-conductance mechanosensitive channel
MEDFGQLFGSMSESIRSFGAEFTGIWLPIQIGLLVLAGVVAYALSALVRRRVDLKSVLTGWPTVLRQLVLATVGTLPVIIFALLTATIHSALLEVTTPARSYLLQVATSLATAWIVISLFTSLLRNHFVNRIVAICAWSIAALSILGLLGNTTKMLDSVGIGIGGGARISLLLILKTTVFLLVTLWLAVVVGNFLDKRVRNINDLTPSIQILLGKVIRLSLLALAVAVVLNAVGIDLSALALFSGAVGVGVGFGLQKIVSNLVSGIILLADKSIKPGDMISVGDSAGSVSTIGARYTLVMMRDGREILLPNEDLVTQRVINWSHSNDLVRLDVKFGVSYASDPHVVHLIALATIAGMPRILSTPAPSCHLINFGDSSLDFNLRFWIADPIKGVARIRSDVRFALWDAFKREGIEIPYPVRDVRLSDATRTTAQRAEAKPA